MHVVQNVQELSDNTAALVVGHSAARLLLQVIVQGVSMAELHHQVDVCLAVDDFVQFDDVRVIQTGQNPDLFVQLLFSLFVLELGPIVLFYRNSFSRVFVDTLLDNCVSPLAQCTAKLVIFDLGVGKHT